MQSSSSSNVRSFLITPETTVSELRQVLPQANTTIYASKMSKGGVCTLYFSPHKDAKASHVHLAVSILIGTGSPEKRMAFLKIKGRSTKELTTEFLKGILEEVQGSAPKSEVIKKTTSSRLFLPPSSTSSFSSFSDLEDTQNEKDSASLSSFSEMSLSEEADKENKPKNS